MLPSDERGDARPEYDVCLSFAGEQRDFVEAVAQGLRDEGLKVFYDGYEQVSLWGKDLYIHLDYVYRKAAKYCIIFASNEYAQKIWTNHERESAQARAIEENREYILPARFDDTDIPGIRGTIGFIDLRALSANQFVKIVASKVRSQPLGTREVGTIAATTTMAASLDLRKVRGPIHEQGVVVPAKGSQTTSISSSDISRPASSLPSETGPGANAAPKKKVLSEAPPRPEKSPEEEHLKAALARTKIVSERVPWYLLLLVVPVLYPGLVAIAGQGITGFAPAGFTHAMYFMVPIVAGVVFLTAVVHGILAARAKSLERQLKSVRKAT